MGNCSSDAEAEAKATLLHVMWRDICSALIVSMLFMAILSAPTASDAVVDPSTPGVTVCGSEGGAEETIASCHACRPDAVMLPAPPALPMTLRCAVMLSDRMGPAEDIVPAPLAPSHTPRAPPAVA